MNALIKPSWLIEGELRDNVWVARLASETTHRSPSATFDFDQIITPYPAVRSLLDSDFELDLITLKLILYYSLEPRPVGWNRSSAAAKITFKTHLAFIRWRIDRGISSNASLTGPWFREFHASMQKGGREGLLNLINRVPLVLSAVENGELEIPHDGRGGVASNQFSKYLGLTKGVEISPFVRLNIEHSFDKMGLRFSRSATDREKPIVIEPTATRENIKGYFKVWWDLWQLRSRLSHDPISYQAFKTRRQMSKWVKSWTILPSRTADAPAYQTSYLINSALKLLLDGDIVDNAISLIKEGTDVNGEVMNKGLLAEVNARLVHIGFPTIGPLYENSRWRRIEGMTVKDFVFNVFPCAARIVTAAFSARRNEEIASSKIDCIEEDSASNSWLNCLIVKNLDRVDRIPVPKSIVRAVWVVNQIRELGQKPGDFLYDFACPISGRPVDFQIGEALDMVAGYFGVPELSDGSQWHFTPHQFRKFFGITYHWRWAFPNLTALTYQYRHFNLDTTRAYIQMKAAEALRMQDEKLAKASRRREIERITDFDGGQSSFVSWVLTEVYSGARLSGSLGRRINQQVQAIKQKIFSELQITQDSDNRGLEEVLRTLTDTVVLRGHPEGHSLCGSSASKQDMLSANCLGLKFNLTGLSPQDGTGADFAFATDEGCISCPLRAGLPTMLPYWDSAVQEVGEVLIGASPALSAAAEARKQTILKHSEGRYDDACKILA